MSFTTYFSHSGGGQYGSEEIFLLLYVFNHGLMQHWPEVVELRLAMDYRWNFNIETYVLGVAECNRQAADTVRRW